MVLSAIGMQSARGSVSYRYKLIAVGMIGIAFLYFVDRNYRLEAMRQNDQRLAEMASSMQYHLSSLLNNLTLVASDMSELILSHSFPVEHHRFTNIAAALQKHYPAISTLVYVGPDRVIREIYPLHENEQAIGLDLSNRPSSPYIEKAIRERRLIIDPPHVMSNGGLAVIARSPIFKNNQFYGLAQTIIQLPEILKNSFVERSGEYVLQLKDDSGRVFWGPELLSGVVESRTIPVGEGNWTISVALLKPHEVNDAILVLIWGGGSVLLLFTLFVVRRDHLLQFELKDEVYRKTHELRLHNELLEKQIAHGLEIEAKIRKSENSLREAQRIAHLGSWEWDLVNDQLFLSDEFCRIFGIVQSSLPPTSDSLLAQVCDDKRDLLKDELRDALRKGGPFHYEYRINRPDGGSRYVRTSGVVEHDAFHAPLRMIGTTQDVTAQMLLLRAVEVSERNYREILESASDGILIAGLDGTIIDGNQRIQRLLGYSRDELLQLSVEQIHPPEEAELLRAAFSVIREHGSSLFEHLLLCKDGSTIAVEVAGTKINFEERPVALGIFRDIRERKRIESELHQYRNHLELLVEQRTSELVALNEDLKSFSYSVSHDLRAPLRAISGFSTALKEDCWKQLDSSGRDYVNRIGTATERMAQLIDGLLQLSGTFHVQVQSCSLSLHAIASEIIQEFRATEPHRVVQFLNYNNAHVQGDPTLLRCLLQNLISNAWKYTRHRADARIEFGCEFRDDVIRYFLRDNGIGFEPRHAHDLFKPFFRLHSDGSYEGNGIGLATAQRIVHRHGGLIWAEGEPGQGATFYFTLS